MSKTKKVSFSRGLGGSRGGQWLDGGGHAKSSGYRAEMSVASIRPMSLGDGAISLSAREHEVLDWLALGKTGKEIAIILSVKESTVRMHIRNILRKLDVTNIPHAVARAFRARILE